MATFFPFEYSDDHGSETQRRRHPLSIRWVQVPVTIIFKVDLPLFTLAHVLYIMYRHIFNQTFNQIFFKGCHPIVKDLFINYFSTHTHNHFTKTKKNPQKCPERDLNCCPLEWQAAMKTPYTMLLPPTLKQIFIVGCSLMEIQTMNVCESRS